jgi:hypothetical protein
MERINPLNPLLGKIERFEQSDSQAKHWESSRVKWTLQRLNIVKQRKELACLAGNGAHTFVEFNRVVDFPMYLCSDSLQGIKPIHRDPKAIHPLWLKSFRSLPFVERYEEHFRTMISTYKHKPLGMIFPRKGFAQGLIIHNGDWELFVAPNSSCHVYRSKKQAMNLIVQPYSGFIDHIREGLGWTG